MIDKWLRSAIKARYQTPEAWQAFLAKLPPQYTRMSIEQWLAALPKLKLSEQAQLIEANTPVDSLDVEGHDVKMVIDSVKAIKRLKACRKEPETWAWLQSHLKPGEVLYDIGANVGAFSLLAHSVTKGQCRVFAFEPSVTTFASLVKNCALNNCGESIMPLCIGLSEKTGTSVFHYADMRAGYSMHAVGAAVNENTGEAFTPCYTQPILTYSLDDLIAQFNLPQPDHIKLDVDNATFDVLRGAMKTLAHPGLRSLMIELSQEADCFEGSLRLIESLGLVNAERHVKAKNDRVGNYVFERATVAV